MSNHLHLIVTGKVRLRAYKDGVLVDEVESHNLVVNAGLNMLCDLLDGTETTGLTYHALGTGTAAPLSTDTALTTEGSRKAITQQIVTANEILNSTFFTSTEATLSIGEVGLFGGASAGATSGSGILFARSLLNYDNSLGAVDLTIDHTITFVDGS